MAEECEKSVTVISRVLLPLDGSEFSERALGMLSVIPAGAELTLFRAVESPEALSEAQRYLEDVATHLERKATTVLAQAEDPTCAILEEVAKGGHDLVVLMTHGRGGLSRLVWGSVAEQVVRRCPVPTLLKNPKHEREAVALRKLLVPLDGTEAADSVLEWVTAFCIPLQAEATLLTAIWNEPEQFREEEKRSRVRAEAVLLPRVRELEREGVKTKSLVKTMRNPAEVILEVAQEAGVDLIAMATEGRTGIHRWFQGSVAEAVLRISPLPVLLVRAQPVGSALS